MRVGESMQCFYQIYGYVIGYRTGFCRIQCMGLCDGGFYDTVGCGIEGFGIARGTKWSCGI